ncbi:MAG TPA: hypothetical protein VLF21_03590 [Candidatus Saccharimonadales bacterium]|nr:hypothetical protein [Candidatus Saccharimonadales bacterium]
MSEPEVFTGADEALRKVILQIKADQWSMPIPEWFPIGRKQEDLDLRKIVNYHAYDEAWVPDVLAGRKMEDVGKDKFDGDLLGDDPAKNYSVIVDKALDAVKNHYEAERICHLSYGDFPAKDYLSHITSFRFFRTYDIAKLIGVEPGMPEELVQGMWEQTEGVVEQYRQMGVYGPRVEVPADASLEDRLLGLVGRQPIKV